MRHLLILMTILAGFLLGCPQQPEQPVSSLLVETADEFTRFGAVMADENGFRDELKRLQTLNTDPGSPGHAPVGNFIEKYDLRSRLDDGRVGLELTDRDTGEVWVLWGWSDEGLGENALQISRDEPTAGGYQLEFNVIGEALTINITARWVQGRFLQISREILLGGLDHELWAPDTYRTWSLDGPWLPYRMIPATHGPYGVVQDGSELAEWHVSNYPRQAMVPAVAAYNRDQGFMLMVVDEHPRRLDRDYQLGWRVPGEQTSGEQINLTYRVFDPTQDEYHAAYLISGLPVRDSIVWEPFELYEQSIDPTLVYAETNEVIAHLGQLTRCFQFVAKPPELFSGTGWLSPAEWVEDPAEISEFIRNASGIWEVRAASATFYDSAVSSGGYVGLGSADLPAGLGLNETALESLAQFDPAALPVFASVDYLRCGEDDVYAEVFPDWLITDLVSFPLVFNVRNPDTAAFLVRKMSADIAAYPQIAGYSFEEIDMHDLPESFTPATAVFSSSQAAACAMYMRTAEAGSNARPDGLSAASGGLSLALPAFTNLYINRNSSYGNELSGTANGSGGTIEVGSGSEFLHHADRFSNEVCWQVFGALPVIGFGLNPAHQVLATTLNNHGHTMSSDYQQYAGFDTYARNQRALRLSGGELQVIHSDPPAVAYTLGGERPAVCREFIALLPADWDDRKYVWIAFHGIGGAVAVDETNLLTVTWADGGHWERKLPPGYWVVEHPSPQSIATGDVVFLQKKPLMELSTGRGSRG